MTTEAVTHTLKPAGYKKIVQPCPQHMALPNSHIPILYLTTWKRTCSSNTTAAIANVLLLLTCMGGAGSVVSLIIIFNLRIILQVRSQCERQCSSVWKEVSVLVQLWVHLNIYWSLESCLAQVWVEMSTIVCLFLLNDICELSSDSEQCWCHWCISLQLDVSTNMHMQMNNIQVTPLKVWLTCESQIW